MADWLTLLRDALRGSGTRSARAEQALEGLLHHFQCSSGTVHALDAEGLLALVAQRGIPPTVLAKIQRIPIGKGMAGIAAQRRAPVQVCNLQTDTTGVVQPGAKDTPVLGSIACPLLDGDRLVGTVGIAKPVAHEFTSAEVADLERAARLFAASLGAGGLKGP